MLEDLYLGIDGGQSHTEAVIADGDGNVVGRGRAGPSNHAEQPGGRERLRRAVVESVERALEIAGKSSLEEITFAAAHCAMTGSAEFKEEVIAPIMRARHLKVGHDAPAALAGAIAGGPGVVVIAGTGAVAYGENSRGENARAGGWGHLFGDEGSAYWIAKEGVRRAMMSEDGLIKPTNMRESALTHFQKTSLGALALSVYSEEISRDQLATFAETMHASALAGDTAAHNIISEAGKSLAALAGVVIGKLYSDSKSAPVACVGGVFRGEFARRSFAAALAEKSPYAYIVEPRFDPAIGALLLAYRAAGLKLDTVLLSNLSGRAEL
ncbi:MAG TPA: BadF/BadG/BcrA/BcrD ATPase family protein [Pyrinomonadaceae bacterium]|jgi:N-acetylglucosamine kinase-like BadF-type ATPase|nr:BadF/BadG/BcrA/BcrD ATPase family protein [Pyrinomonadaceae bacterium]